MALTFSPNYRVLTLALLLLPVLFWLGHWQLQRAAEKEAIATHYEQRQRQLPVPFAEIATFEDWAFLPVTLSGRFDREHQFLLDNRVHEGQVGYEVLAPLHLISGEWVMINRGWIKAPPLRTQLPELPSLPEDEVKLQAEVYVPPGQGYQLAGIESHAQQWPKVVTVFDSEFLGKEIGSELFAYQLRLKGGEPGALITDWPPINVSPAKHRAYAVQWFAMAAALVIWLLFASVRKKT